MKNVKGAHTFRIQHVSYRPARLRDFTPYEVGKPVCALQADPFGALGFRRCFRPKGGSFQGELRKG